MVIKRATNYFEVQKYRMAYEQIVGVDVKNRDQLIRDKIYCVMYVQQQLDSYDNFNKLGMHENALDSLIKGVRKYNEHIEEARELGIEKDLEDLYAQINGELAGRYGVNTDTLNRWISLDRETYSNELRNYVSQLDISVVSN